MVDMLLSQNDILFVQRKWGSFLQFSENQPTTIKLLYVDKGKSISYQFHNYRSEQWYVIKGKVLVTKGIESQILMTDQSITIDVKEKHKLEGLEDSIILEISRGHFSEDDIVRL